MGKRLRAIVIQVSKSKEKGKIRDVGEAWLIAKSLIKKREKVEHNVPILDVVFSAPFECYIFIYERVRMIPQERLRR